MRSLSKLALPASALVLAVGPFAAGQTAPRADRARRPRPQDASPPPPPLGLVMQKNGGSLLRAELSTRAAAAADPLIFGASSPAAGADAQPPAASVSAASVSLFAVPEPQPKTIKKHDLVTILVREDSAFSSSGTTDLKKQEDFDTKLDAFIQLKLSHMELKGIIPGGAAAVPEIKAEGTRDYKGDATVDRTDTFTARITAEVVDVKPNGTLVLQAVKRIKTDEEEQRMILTGVCRADDIGADNTILSTQLYDLELEKNHKGAVDDTTKRGFIPRLLDQVNPF